MRCDASDRTSTFLFLKAEQNVSVLNFPIWFADSLELELSGRLKGLDTFSGDDRRFGGVSIQRSPIYLGFGIGVPDREYDDVSLAIIDNGFGKPRSFLNRTAYGTRQPPARFPTRRREKLC
jgi:hypothetical protein